MRSFSNLWFWIALAVLWSSVSHWIVGVPFDLVTRARAGQEAAREDVLLLAGVHARRVIYIFEMAGVWMTGLATFGITGLAVAGFQFGVEFCQAVFLLALPMSIVSALNFRTAKRIVDQPIDRVLYVLKWHRVWVQGVGMIAIFATSMWGMYTNINASVLGG